jgi:hypothetical protein
MKKIFMVMCLTCLVLTGCATGVPQNKYKTENGWQVEKCFEKDGFTVYRFSDGHEGWRYYVVPQGELIDNVRTGKNVHQENNTTTKPPK